jgi:hypothetical protein
VKFIFEDASKSQNVLSESAQKMITTLKYLLYKRFNNELKKKLSSLQIKLQGMVLKECPELHNNFTVIKQIDKNDETETFLVKNKAS